MKLKNVLIACILVGCSTKTETPMMTRTDSLIVASDSMMVKAECSGKVLDSVTTVTTEKVTNNVNELTNTITNYETQMRSAIKVKTVEKVIHDTVYIETKKNFWGRTKTNVTKASDSTTNQTEAIDSL